ncbi:uncharacterized protein [Hetaerina americana]|uniref:uncharacterized protein n=1 Tax=Hetaerina americana TaxID=62018 RepID=UPI003A7F2303
MRPPIGPRQAAVVAAVAIVLGAMATASASPHGEGGLVGARKLAQATDCRGVVAFSGVAAKPSTRLENGTSTVEEDSSEGTKLGFHDLLTDKSVGWSRESGEFTCVCPGLYHFAFSATGARVSLRRKEADASWKTVVETGEGGGAHVVLLDMDVGDAAAVWLAEGQRLPPEDGAPRSSFSGYRLAKK